MFKSTLPKIARVTPREDLNEPIRAPMSEFEKGAAAFVDETQALGGGLVGMAGQAVAQHGPEITRPMAEGVRDWGIDVYKQNMEEATKGVQAPKVARIEDIKLGEAGGLERLGNWAAYQGTKGVLNVGSMVAGGGLGGAVAKGMVKKEVKTLANKKLASTLTNGGISAGAREAAAQQVGKAVTKGRIAGALGAGFGMEGGESFGGMVTDGVAPADALGPAIAVGGINSALEFVAPFKVAKGLGLLGPAKQGILQKIRDVPELRKKAQMLAGRVAKGALGTGATEGITEGVQELVQLAGERWAKDEEMLAGLDPEARSRILNAAAAGFLTGGLVGGATGPFTARTAPTGEQQTKEGGQIAQEDQAAPTPTPPETGAPGAPATPTKPELTTAQWREVVSRVQPRPDETPQEFTQRLALIEQSALEGEWIPAEQLSAAEAPAELSGLLERPVIEGEVVRPTIEGEVAQDAEAIREDARLLPGPGEEQQLLQREGGENRELITQEGGKTRSEMAPNEGGIPLTQAQVEAREQNAIAPPAGVEFQEPIPEPPIEKTTEQLLLPDLREKALALPKLGAVNEAVTQEDVIQPVNGQTTQDAAIADIESRPTPELKELTGSLLELYQSGDLTPSQYRDVRQVLARGELDRVVDIIQQVEATGRQPGVSYQRKDAKMTADMAQIINLIGMKMYKGSYSDVVIKELMQNAFDAVKAQSVIMGVPGRIDVLVNHGNNSITIRDNGVGMTLNEVQDVFLKLGGTGKGGKGTSGGLGFAKGSFLPGASRVVLETTKNGKTTRMDVDPKQLMLGGGVKGALDDSGPVALQGTTLTLYIPENYLDEDGEQRYIQFPYGYNSINFFKKPLIGPTEINYYDTYSDFTPEEAFATLEPNEVVPQGINFDPEKAGVTYHTPAKTKWGSMEIYFGKKRHSRGGRATHSVLSDGIFQFDLDLTIPNTWDKVPYDIIVDIKSNVTTRSAKYPFNNSREGFSKGIEQDVKALKKYLLNIANGIDATATAQNFENMKQLPRVEIEGVPKKLEGDELRKAQDAQKEYVKEKPAPAAQPKPKKIKIADGKVWETDGRGRATGKPVVDTTEKETFEAEKENVKKSDLMMEVGLLGREKPVYHNNTTVDYVDEFGAPAAGFFSELGSVMTEMLELAGEHGGYGYHTMKKENKDALIFAGISIDKQYHGVTVTIPYNGFFLNPLAPGEAKSLPGLSESFYLTMIHELAHSQSMKHDERHTLEIHSLYNKFADLGLNIELTEKIGNVLYKYKDFYNPMREKYDESTTSNVAESLDKGEGATKLERFGAQPAANVAAAEDGIVRPRSGSEMGRTLESRADLGGEPAGVGIKPRTVDQARREVADALSAGWVRRAENAGMLEFVDAEGPNGQSADFDQGSGKITIYTRSLPAEGTTAAVALHEGSHAGMDVLLGGKLGRFAKEVHSMAEANDVAKQAVAKGEAASWQWLANQLDVPFDPANPEGTKTAVNAALKEAPNAQELAVERGRVRDEEVLAYYVQGAATKGGGLFRRIVNSIKAGWLATPIGRALSAVGLGPQLSDGVAVELAKRSTKFALSLQETAKRLEQTQPADGTKLESRVWHASPHNWAPEPGFPWGRPRLDKVGTGEGGQLFGWGWYSAENEKVSGPESSYARSFSREKGIKVDGEAFARSKGNVPYGWTGGGKEFSDGSPEALALDYVSMYGVETGKSELRADARSQEPVIAERYIDAAEWLGAHKVEEFAAGASIFRLKIPDSAIDKMLRWELPLSQQPPAVKEALKGIRAKLEQERKDFINTRREEEIRQLAHNIMDAEGERWGVRRKDVNPEYDLDKYGAFVRGPFEGFILEGSDEKPYVEIFGRRTYLSPDIVTGYAGDPLEYKTKEAAQAAALANPDGNVMVVRTREGTSMRAAVKTAEASPSLKSFMEKVVNSPHMPASFTSGTGEQLYQHLQETLPQIPGEHHKKKVSEYLASLGIVGNKYLDWGSRDPEGTVKLYWKSGKVVENPPLEMIQVVDMVNAELLAGEAQNTDQALTLVEKELTARLGALPDNMLNRTARRNTIRLQEAVEQIRTKHDLKNAQTFNYVVWDQPTLDAVAHLNPQNDMQKFGMAAKRFRNALSAETSALERMSSALSERGRLESNTQDVSPLWYSQLASTVADAKQAKMAPQQWIGWLKKQPGVKQEELDDTGLVDWLETQPKAVERERVEQFLADGGIKVEEVLSGELQHVEWTEPGGENQRELLITKPRDPFTAMYDEMAAEMAELDRRVQVLTRRLGSAFVVDSARLVNEIEEIREARRQLKVQMFPLEPREPEKEFVNPAHYNEPNILAHVRFNERTDQSGDKVLFVEEVQSDWHQKGRTGGYQTEEKEVWRIYDQAGGRYNTFDSAEEAEATLKVLNGPDADWGDMAGGFTLRRELDKEGAVPDAPFKSSWPLLGMKRMIKWAADNGFDKVAWTPGSMQNKRYSLSSRIEALRYGPTGMDNRYAVIPYDADGPLMMDEELPNSLTLEEVEETFGAEVAERMRNGEGEPRPNSNMRTLRGEQLDTKGGGMQGFYDKMLPSALNKFGKKYGAKAETTRIAFREPGDPVANQELWDAGLESHPMQMQVSVDRQGRESYVVLNKVTGKEIKADSYEEAREISGRELSAMLKGTEVWSFPITPKLKEQAARGMPLYSQSSSVSAAWYTSPVSTSADDVNRPGILNKIQHLYVEKFNDLWTKSKEAATKFNLAKSKRSSAQQDFEDEFVTPWVQQAVKLSKALTQAGKPFSVEQANAAFAAWHIVEDNVNHLIALKNSNEQSIHLEKAMRAAARDLGRDSELGKELIHLSNAHAKGRKHMLRGKNWDGSQPMAADGVTTRELTSSEVKMKMMEKLEELFDTRIENTKVWKATAGLEDQRMGWEMLKHHGSGFATPETASSDFEVQQKLNDILSDPNNSPKNAHELYAEVKDNPIFQSMTTEAQKIATLTRKTLVRGGLITQEEANAMGKEYEHWVPLRREQYDFQASVDALFARAGRGGRPQVRAGTPEVDAPVHSMQNLFASYDAAVTAAESNIAREFFAKQVEENPQDWAGWFKVEQDKDSMRSYGKYGFVKTRRTSANPEDIPFYRDGERWLLKPEKKNERAKMLSVAVQNLDSQELGPVFKVMQGVNSWIRWANISASPAFLLVNAPRDFGTAMLNLKGTKLANFTGDVAKEAKSSAKDLWKHFHPDPNKRVRSDLIAEWERAGGRISFVESLRPNDATWGSLESRIRHRQGVFRPVPGQEVLVGEQAGKAVELGRNFLERIERMNIIAENVMRYSTWKVAKENGLSNDEAALLSKDVTTNFDRKGLRAKTLGTYWLFFNATVQGNAQVLRNVFKGPNKEKLWGALAATMAFAFLNDQLGAALSDDEDGDGRTDWDSVPDWKKEKFGRIAGSNLFWPGESEKFATVPLPWVFNTVWRMGEMMSEAARGVKDVTEIPADTVGLMLNTFNPIGSTETTGLQMASPTAFDPLVQIAENIDAFGRPLGPTQFPGQENQPDSQMAWLSTPPRYKWLAREVNQMTGGSAAEKGLVDWRPSTFKVLADTLMGGGGRFMEQVGTSAVSTVQGKPPAVEKLPVLKPFLFDPADPIEAGLYHERQAKVAQAAKAERVFKTGPERDLMELQRVRREYAGELRMKKTADDVARQIKDLRKQLRVAQSNGQENRVDMLKKRIEQAQQRFNKTWNRRVPN